MVCTDFSPEAENAMQYAAALARDKGYKILLFSLQNISIHTQNAQLSGEYFYDQIKAKQNKLIQKANEFSLQYDIHVENYLASGDFFEEVEKCIAISNVDLVVLGMAERTFSQSFLGNTTTKAVHRLKKPILIIPMQKKYEGIRKTLFAYDAQNDLNWPILDTIYKMVGQLDSEIEVFNVSESVNDFTEVMDDEDFTQGYDLDHIRYSFKIIQSAEVIKAIEEEIDLTNADLLIMIPHRYNFIESILHRSKTTMMASGARIPLLSIPE